MRSTHKRLVGALVGLGMVLGGGAASAAPCGDGPSGFNAWVQDFEREAVSRGISPRVAQAALSGVSYDSRLIAYDRTQKPFKLSFEQFVAKRAPASLISQARSRIQRNKALFDRIEAQYGVPAPILATIWGMETAFGAIQGKKNVYNGLATLAYDCRRTEMFQRELIAAMQLVDRGDLTMGEMRGAEHGEIGQAQFLPSNYLKYAVDGDGDGRRDMVRSSADTLASIANYLRAKGWRAGGGWEEGSANFAVLAEWNKARVYQRAIAYAATQIDQGGSRAQR
ncbi:lytic transglycosylase [Methylopila jiangsuensis]|uniref:Lytic transglycosylase n=1 Tax=Methylopila jiangsuensis TaxID=586230 RepID=A0A9W6JE07_9HYPH|nr:lytic murein transglycosylase [Methylopila jiangsuensis]MDR6286083.1 lytic murein transglycosylase [Methylopila jiangsuensis]GLK75841.1 lytic transglycosylase [Methylopila jiangsuensis]